MPLVSLPSELPPPCVFRSPRTSRVSLAASSTKVPPLGSVIDPMITRLGDVMFSTVLAPSTCRLPAMRTVSAMVWLWNSRTFW